MASPTGKLPSNRIKIKHRVSTTPGANMKAAEGAWWDKVLTTEACGAMLWDTVKLLKTHHQPRHLTDSLYVGMYEGRPPYWLGAMSSSSGVAMAAELTATRPAMNVVRQVVDTAGSQLAKNPTEVRVLTSGGTWREQKRAKGLTKYLSGAFDAMGYQAAKQRAFDDGCLSQAGGLVKFWTADARVRCERALPRTIYWNDAEGSHPHNLYQYDARSRESLTAAFPKHADIIRDAPKSAEPVNPAYRRRSGLQQFADMVDVAEAWHVGPTPQKPGRHVIMVDGGVILDEEWQHPWFPFARFTWADEHEGFGGLPLADALVGYQVRLAKWMRKVLKILDTCAIPKIWKEQGAEISDDMLTNEVGDVGTYRGSPPVMMAGNSVPPDLLNFGWKIKEEAFAEAGFSLMAVQGQRPSGIDSGEAITAFNDITSSRHVLKGQRLERMDIAAANIIIGFSKDMYASGSKDIRVLAPGTKFLKEISWKDVDMEEDAYTLRCFDVSSLPTHVVGRIDAVAKIIKSGIMPAEDVQSGVAMKLINFPDLDQYATLETANREMAEMQVDEALYEGKYIGPEPFQDLILLRTLAQKSLALAYNLKDVPDLNLEYLNRLMVESDEMQKRNAKKDAPPAPMMDPASAAAAAGIAPPQAAPALQQAALPGEPGQPSAPGLIV